MNPFRVYQHGALYRVSTDDNQVVISIYIDPSIHDHFARVMKHYKSSSSLGPITDSFIVDDDSLTLLLLKSKLKAIDLGWDDRIFDLDILGFIVKLNPEISFD